MRHLQRYAAVIVRILERATLGNDRLPRRDEFPGITDIVLQTPAVRIPRCVRPPG